jgi:hypothetical protein
MSNTPSKEEITQEMELHNADEVGIDNQWTFDDAEYHLLLSDKYHQPNGLNTFNHCEHGDVEVRVASLDLNGTDVAQGIEIKSLEGQFDIIEIVGDYDIDELEADDVEKLIDENIKS